MHRAQQGARYTYAPTCVAGGHTLRSINCAAIQSPSAGGAASSPASGCAAGAPPGKGLSSACTVQKSFTGASSAPTGGTSAGWEDVGDGATRCCGGGLPAVGDAPDRDATGGAPAGLGCSAGCPPKPTARTGGKATDDCGGFADRGAAPKGCTTSRMEPTVTHPPDTVSCPRRGGGAASALSSLMLAAASCIRTGEYMPL